MEQHDILGELRLELLALLGRTPVLDHDGFVTELPDIGKCLQQGLDNLDLRCMELLHIAIHGGRDPGIDSQL
jgi:hypothetical protein